jgi:purine-binding chemotaxis protein CheW
MSEVEAERVALCVFAVGEQEFAVDVMRVRTVLRGLTVTVVPQMPEHVEGMVQYRGEVLPLIDLRKRLGLAGAAPAKGSRMIVCLAEGRWVALRVDKVLEVMRVRREGLQPAPPMLSAGQPYVVGVVEGPGGRLLLLLHLGALLAGSTPAMVPPLSGRGA